MLNARKQRFVNQIIKLDVLFENTIIAQCVVGIVFFLISWKFHDIGMYAKSDTMLVLSVVQAPLAIVTTYLYKKIRKLFLYQLHR